MIETFDLSINTYCSKSKGITIDDFFLEIFNASNLVDIITEKVNRWYLTGYSKKDSFKYTLFEEDEKLNKIIEKDTIKNDGMINQSIWNGEPEGSTCSISHYMKFMKDHKKINLVIEINQKPLNMYDIIESITKIVLNKEKSWVMVDSKCYWLNGLNVFPDRAYVAWMIYIPHVILKELIPEAAKVVPIINNGKQIGTVVISTEEIFDGSKKEHIEKANDIEIRLLDLGMLPLMTEL